MKNYLFIAFACIITTYSYAQTSVQDGDWTNPSTWDCNCIPYPFLSPLDITINHVVTANIHDGINNLDGRTYFNGGSLTIGSNGTLLQMGEGDLFLNNSTTVINGILDMRRIAVSQGSAIYNGVIQNCDSLWNDSCNVVNNGVITTYDYNVYTNGSTTNNGTINVTNNMLIQGEYNNTPSGSITIAVDFSNLNTTGGRALYTNNGTHVVGNNFLNATNDTIKGTGIICIGNLSTNQGTVLGTQTISTPTSSFSVNLGFVAPTVTFNNNCLVNLSELKSNPYSVSPNPFSQEIEIDGVTDEISIQIISVQGTIVKELIYYPGQNIDLIELDKGVYFIKINDALNSTIKVIKE